MSRIYIVILNWNGWGDTIECLESVLRLDYPEYQVVRRMKENIGDIDILATGANKEKIFQTFTHLPEVKEVLATGETKASVIVEGGTQIDLRVVEEDSYGAALQYFTGSKGHNIHLRGIAKVKGLKINEYGVFKGK